VAEYLKPHLTHRQQLTQLVDRGLACPDETTAIETVEIGLRSRLAYVLGLRDRLGHVHRESLDADACARPARRSGGQTGQDAFEQWTAKYNDLEHEARRPGKFNPSQIGSTLAHAARMEPRNKVYIHLAVLAYLVRGLDPIRIGP
jgi:hypothetical protein